MKLKSLIIAAFAALLTAVNGEPLKIGYSDWLGYTLFEVAKELSRRLASTFLRDANGRRPVYGATAKFQDDPHWRDLILFFEYFQGDNGAGLGASHQTGWTGVVAKLIQLFGMLDAKQLLEGGKQSAFNQNGDNTKKQNEGSPISVALSN